MDFIDGRVMERIFIDSNTWATHYNNGWTIFHKRHGLLLEGVTRQAVEEARDNASSNA